MKFILETDKNGFLDDFVNDIRLSIEQRNWYYCDEEPFTYKTRNISEVTEKDLQEYVPVGSIDFVSKFIKYYTGSPMKAINVPDSLNRTEFTGRKIWNALYSEVRRIAKEINGEFLFIKPYENVKEFQPFTQSKTEYTLLPAEKFVTISETIDIDSEWRFFVNKNKYFPDLQVMECIPYSWKHNLPKVPDVEVVNKIIKEYKNSPPSYTLDVGVTKDGKTILIEVHNFISCGTYGLQNINFPLMTAKAYRWAIR